MKSKREILANLYIRSHLRGTGRTAALVRAAIEMKGTLVVLNHQHARELKRDNPTLNVIAVDSSDKLIGQHSPVVIDHFATQVLLGEAFSEFDAEIERLKKRIKDMGGSSE